MREKVILGGRYGQVIVILKIPSPCKEIRTTYLCKCDCGNETKKDSKSLNAKTVTCGCHLNKSTKVCAMCKIDKPKSEYHTRLKNKKIGVQTKCKKCTSIYKKDRYWNNHQVQLENHTKSRLKPENVIQRKEYYAKNKQDYTNRYKKTISDPIKKEHRRQVAKQSRIKNAEKNSIQKREYYSRPEVKERIKAKHNERMKNDIHYNITRRLRDRFRKLIVAIAKGNKITKYKTVLGLIGCDIPSLKLHLESTFTDGMSWEIFVTGKIHVDHIKPCKLFDLSNLTEQEKCFNFLNLQCLWDVDNLKKNAKYDGD